MAQQLDLKIDHRKLAEIAHRGSRRAAAFVALGEKAWSDESLHSLAMQVPFQVHFLPDPLPKQLADEVRGAFRLWLAGNAITEIVQGLSLFADEYYNVGVLITMHGNKIEQEKLDQIEKFKLDTNLASKFKKIEADCKLKSPLVDHADCWTRARNCYAHNQGVIRARDCSPGTNELTVSWRQPEISVNGERIDNIIGHRIEGGGVLELRFGLGEKKFAIGGRLEFSEQEILHICLTSFMHVERSVADLHKRLLELVGGKKQELPAAAAE